MKTTSATQLQPLPSLDSFLSGKPERVVMTDRPIVAITWLHTNEPHAPSVAHTVYSSRPDLAPYVNYICGNPHTAHHEPEKGFTHTDLNRSFGQANLSNPQSYEEHRAVEVLKFIENAQYVLDLHNTVCTNFGKVMIIDERYLHKPAIRKIIAASPLKRIMLMSADTAALCLNGEPKARTITFDYEMGLTTSEAIPDMLSTIEALVNDHTPAEPFEREIFRTQAAIPKSEDPGLHVKNFEPYTDKEGKTRYATFLGTGPRSYREDPTKDYCGFSLTMERAVL